MRVLLLSGSPRKGGNSEGLLEAASEVFEAAGWEISRFYLSEKTILPCIGCETCLQTGVCSQSGDDAEALFRDMEACDAVLIASPVYYRNVTAQLKAVMDRTHYTDSFRPFKGKPGGAMAVGRGEGAGQASVLSLIYTYLLSAGAYCVAGELNGVSAKAGDPGDILRQPRRLDQARKLARNVLIAAQRLQGGEET